MHDLLDGRHALRIAAPARLAACAHSDPGARCRAFDIDKPLTCRHVTLMRQHDVAFEPQAAHTGHASRRVFCHEAMTMMFLLRVDPQNLGSAFTLHLVRAQRMAVELQTPPPATHLRAAPRLRRLTCRSSVATRPLAVARSSQRGLPARNIAV